MTHHKCPYTRPHSSKPSKPPNISISGPPQQATLCLNKLLTHLISINSTTQSPPSNTLSPSPGPSSPLSCHSSFSSPSTVSSTDSTPVSPSSTESSESPSEPESITSTASTASDQRWHPRLPIRYNEAFLKKLNGTRQVTTLNKLSIPLPPSDTDEEEDMDMT